MAHITGRSSHKPTESFSEPRDFKIKVLPAGSAPKASTHQPNVGGELAPGQPNLSADTTYDKATEGSKVDVHKGLGAQEDDDGDKENEGHRVEIKSATEKEPETAESL